SGRATASCILSRSWVSSATSSSLSRSMPPTPACTRRGTRWRISRATRSRRSGGWRRRRPAIPPRAITSWRAWRTSRSWKRRTSPAPRSASRAATASTTSECTEFHFGGGLAAPPRSPPKTDCRRQSRPSNAQPAIHVAYNADAMEFRYVICDVFTDTPLTGNQLAVFTDARLIPETLLQPIAREMNFSETVFVYPAAADGHARIRIFTPFNELPFAGHPVLGSAFVLAAPLQLPTIVLETGIGPVPIVLERDGARIVFGRMTQPLPTVSAEPAAAAIVGALGGVTPILPVERYVNGPTHVMVTVGSPDEVAKLAPDLAALARATPASVSCFAGSGRRWK